MENNIMENSSLKIIETFCLWSDLLGFGKAFYDSNWSLYDKRSQNNLIRINLLREHITKSSNPLFEKILSLNDGFIRTFDFQNCYIYDILL